MDLIIITGLSGSGKSTALKVLEDLDFFTMDNIPFKFAGVILDGLKSSKNKKIAMGLDIRTLINQNDFEIFLSYLETTDINYTIIFLEASKQIMLNRFNLTRRKHPLSKTTLLQSIVDECELMKGIKEKSNIVIDTTFLSVKNLAKKIEEVVNSFKNSILLNIHIQSFGFKYGIPMDSDLVFDTRVLPNPYYMEELRKLSGLNDEVYNYVMRFDESKELYKKILDLIEFLIPKYIKDEKKHLTVGIGCSGGKHRSVTFVRKLKKDLEKNKEVNIYTFHREKELGNW